MNFVWWDNSTTRWASNTTFSLEKCLIEVITEGQAILVQVTLANHESRLFIECLRGWVYWEVVTNRSECCAYLLIEEQTVVCTPFHYTPDIVLQSYGYHHMMSWSIHLKNKLWVISLYHQQKGRFMQSPPNLLYRWWIY